MANRTIGVATARVVSIGSTIGIPPSVMRGKANSTSASAAAAGLRNSVVDSRWTPRKVRKRAAR